MWCNRVVRFQALLEPPENHACCNLEAAPQKSLKLPEKTRVLHTCCLFKSALRVCCSFPSALGAAWKPSVLPHVKCHGSSWKTHACCNLVAPLQTPFELLGRPSVLQPFGSFSKVTRAACIGKSLTTRLLF